MLYGFTPFVGNYRDETFKNICNKKITFPVHKNNVSNECKLLITSLLHSNSKKRLGAVKDAYDIKILCSLKTYDGIHYTNKHHLLY